MAKQFIVFKIGSGESIFLWFDLWHPNGVLLEKYGNRLIYNVGSHINVRLSSVIQDGNWFWLEPRSDDLV